MKKITGIFFIAAAVLLLGSSFKPLVDEMPRLTKIESPTTLRFVDEMPRLTKVEAPTTQRFVDEMPRLTKIEEPAKKYVDELPRLV
ncbi:hypothetical protein [Exiguobacterium alkaliphilum]|uniref:Uncharacterized protein n=1 Tax=Exiguobacterium alkaliphilum TaxID=1428684 RepID=A0ABT2L257_9BACL|nr:hypothetical protein [Exiguobacterium alkaliphilum]MCT4796766.1 hypothetical protein [Exiguobacterium alkaliphilum]